VKIDDDSVLQALCDYQAALEAGERPDRRAILDRFPELAGELAAGLDGLDFVHQVAPPLRDGGLEHEELRPSTPLGDFRILREVGRGGMGVVYEAEQMSLGRRVALKVLPFAAVLDSRYLRRFKNEAQAAAHLHHTHIVPVHAVGCDRGVHYYAMQFIEGPTLAGLIAELRGRAAGGGDNPSPALAALTPERSHESRHFCGGVARLGIQAAQALHYAHDSGVVHRDIKPANLIVDADGHLWITDFGLASTRQDSGLTMTGDVLGTLRYMSPEQALGQPVDHRTDLYSLGVTLYELLALEAAFPGDDPNRILQALAVAEPVPLRARNPAVPPELETILLKAMAKDPADRYATGRELAEDLERFLEDKPIRARRPTLRERAAKWARRHRRVVAASVAALVVAVAGLAVSNLLIREQRDLAAARGDRLQTLNARAGDTLDDILEDVRNRLPPGSQVGAAMHTVLEETRRFYEPLAVPAGDDPTERFQAARAHWGLGRVASLLGKEGAEASLRTAVTELEALAEAEPAYRVYLARALVDYGRDLARARPDEAGAWLRRALAEWDRALADAPGDPARRHGRARALGVLGGFLADAQRYEEASSAWEGACAALRELAQEHPDERRYREDLARSWYELGVVHVKAGDDRGADQPLVKANNRLMELQREAPGNERYLADYQRVLLVLQPVEARLRGLGKPPEPFAPRVEPGAARPEASLTLTPAHFEAEFHVAIAGALPLEGFSRKIVVHRGDGEATLLGNLDVEGRTRFLPLADGNALLAQWRLVDRHGDTLLVNTRGAYSREDRGWKGEYWIEAGTGRYEGARGSGRAVLFFHRGKDKRNGVRFEGTIYRER